MAHYHPNHPYFTIQICKKGILKEHFRLIDVGVRGGLQDHWWFFGDHLEAWGFDPLFDEGVGPLIATNKYPDRIHYLNVGLGDEDCERPFCFIPDNPPSSFFAATNGTDTISATWQKVGIRRLDSLFAEGTVGPVDFMKMDAETYEVEIIKGAREFLSRSGIFGIESEVSFFRTPRNPRSHFVDLYEELRPHGFMVYDAGLQRVPRAPLANGFPKAMSGGRYSVRELGRPVVIDMLFFSKIFENGMQGSANVDRLLKMIAVAELYGLQDVALDILFANQDQLSKRLEVEEAADWLVREDRGSTLTYQQYRTNKVSWGELTEAWYDGEGCTTSVLPNDPASATRDAGASILRIAHQAGGVCTRLQFDVVLNCYCEVSNDVVLAFFQNGIESPVAILTEPLKPGETTAVTKTFYVPMARYAAAVFEVSVGLGRRGGTLILNRPQEGEAPPTRSYVRVCDIA